MRNKINAEKVETICQEIYKIFEQHGPTELETGAVLGMVNVAHILRIGGVTHMDNGHGPAEAIT